MKCTVVTNVDVDVKTFPQNQTGNIRWRHGISHVTRKKILIPYLPAGTDYEHPNAAMFVNHGAAISADDECAAASQPMNANDRAQLQLGYQATMKGIHEEHDRNLFFAGVILGYEPVGEDGQLAYIPGPNYAAWKEAQDEQKADSLPSDI